MQLAPLQAPVISRETLARFASATGDDNPIHLDRDAARSAGMDDVFAHGMLSMAYLARLLTDHAPIERLFSFRVRFTALTPLHGQPTCRGVVRELTHHDDGDRAHLELSVTLADGTQTLAGEAVVGVRSYVETIDREAPHD